MQVKLRPSAVVDVIVKNSSGEAIASSTTFNALKINVIHDFGKGLFNQRFTIRMGSGSAASDYADVYLKTQMALVGNPVWPTALLSSQWPLSVVSDNIVEWSTEQKFEIPTGSYIGILRELGFNFYGDQSNVIHARAVLPTDLNIDETYALEINYKLILRADFSESSYICNLSKNGQLSTHTVSQVWSKRVTLWDILGVVPPAANCKAYSGQLNGYDVEPDGYLSQSFVTTVEQVSDTAIALESKFTTDDANTVDGIQSITWDTIPVKMSFNPPLPKTSETDLVFKLMWELS